MTGDVQASHPDLKSRVLVLICCCDDPSCLMFCEFFCEREGGEEDEKADVNRNL